MGGKSEARERQQKAEGGGSVVASARRCHSAAARFSGRRVC